MLAFNLSHKIIIFIVTISSFSILFFQDMRASFILSKLTICDAEQFRENPRTLHTTSPVFNL